MPNWKKLIVSGSDATLNSLTVTTSGSFYDDLTISGSNSSLIIKGDGNKFARITHDGNGLIVDGSVQNQYISIGSPTWNWTNGVRIYGDLEQTGSAGGTATFEGPTQSTLNLKTTTNSKNNYIVGTTAGNLSLRPNGSESLLLRANGNATFAGDVSMVNGNSTGKFAVMSTAVHGSYDFYNNGTSYFNGSVVIDATCLFSDNEQLRFGNTNDFLVYHNSTTNVNYISSQLDRQLSINANIIQLTNQANTTTYLKLESSGATFAGDITLGAKHIGRDADNYVGFETDNLINQI